MRFAATKLLHASSTWPQADPAVQRCLETAQNLNGLRSKTIDCVLSATLLGETL